MTAFDFLDYLGTAVFAISGAMAGRKKHFDLFGVTILAAVTAIGGGTLRDVLIGRTPVGWMEHTEYLYIILGATIFTILFQSLLKKLQATLVFFDAIGLAMFTIIGVELGIQNNLNPIICVLLGTMTAAFGGVIRDVLSTEAPLIFREEIYASISIMGGFLFLLLNNTTISLNIVYVITSLFMIMMRLIAVKKHWELPTI